MSEATGKALSDVQQSVGSKKQENGSRSHSETSGENEILPLETSASQEQLNVSQAKQICFPKPSNTRPEQSIEPHGQFSGYVSNEILPNYGQLVAKREMGGDLLEPSDIVVSTHRATIINIFSLK